MSFDFHLEIGEECSFAKTVSESDVYMFAGLTGDLSVVHCNEQYMQNTAFGRRIAHGVLVVGLMSTAASVMYSPKVEKYTTHTPVSLGYDRIRFIGPVFFGDTVTIKYRIAKMDPVKVEAHAEVEAINQHGAVVAVAVHRLRWVPVSTAKAA
ncbi:MAG: dehydratase [Rhizobiaceae bacterium]|nr:dehydratase [Rhizobiaceae bacterium]